MDRTIVHELQADVVVIGGGLAGQAAVLHLSRAGLKVICLEPREEFSKTVGESLDWSAPQLFANLGLKMDELVKAGAATYKRHIMMTTPDGSQQEYLPGAWLAKRPWNVELRTLHLDRLRIHEMLQEAVQSQDVTILHERAIGFETEDSKILCVQSSTGKRIDTRWVVDASGAAASVLGRKFSLPSASYGPRKIALWAHFPTEEWTEGTTLYPLSSGSEYMEWMWEIPVRPGISSIGYVAPGWKAKHERASGQSNGDILARQMEKFPRLREVLGQSKAEHTAATSFLCRTYKTVCGPNWIIIGEAASQSDPITGNGVTAALRHAAEGSALICKYQKRGKLPMLARFVYNLRVSGVGYYFNSLIEKLYYQTAIRSYISVFAVARIYTIPAWLTNVVYSRTRPTGLVGTLALCGAMLALRGAAWGFFRASCLFSHRKQRKSTPRNAGPVIHGNADSRKEQNNALHLSR